MSLLRPGVVKQHKQAQLKNAPAENIMFILVRVVKSIIR